jgi:branched-chain amino acid transport system permease protein
VRGVILQVMVGGLLMGSIYGLVSVSLSVVFGVMKIINFAHGALLMVALYGAYIIWKVLGINPYLGSFILLPALYLFGYVIQNYVIKRVFVREIAREPIGVLLLTLGMMYLLENVALFIFGPDFFLITSESILKENLVIADLIIPVSKGIGLLVGAAVTGFIMAFMKYTDIGRAMRATGQDREVAKLMGIDPIKIYNIVYAGGTAAVGVAGIVLSTFFYIFPSVGQAFGLRAFIIVVLGGIGSPLGAFLGGILIGLVEAIASQIVTAAAAEAVIFLMFVAVLYFKPSGLFGIAGER